MALVLRVCKWTEAFARQHRIAGTPGNHPQSVGDESSNVQDGISEITFSEVALSGDSFSRPPFFYRYIESTEKWRVSCLMSLRSVDLNSLGICRS